MILFDTETTGLVKPSAMPIEQQPQVIEFAAIKLDNKTLKEVGRLESFIDPGIPIPPEITKITGITDAQVKGAPSFGQFFPKLQDFYFGESTMVAHNLAFDRDVLYHELLRLGALTRFPWPPKHICTVEASYPIKGHRLKLGLLHELATGKVHNDAHRAMGDVEALVTCVKWLRKEGRL